MQPVSGTDYRPDIDGLRAVAVLSVLAFHYGIGLPGGFSGVDVFFVISGYLITSRISREIEAGKFSLLDFYERRIRRIVPALLVMLLVCLALGKFLLMPGDYKSTAISAALAAFGVSNFYFNAHTGYFDQASDLMPLIHTWSLAVEEQFYFAWPLLLIGIAAFTRSRAGAALAVAAITVIGFAASLFWFAADAKSAFYMVLPRAWELAIGGLLVFLPALPRRIGEWAAVAGLALIGTGFFTLTAKDFPGISAAIPCVGAALVIWQRKEATRAAAWLGLLSPIGLISYSLYLWHWPIWVFFRFYINSGTPGPIETVALTVISIAAAAVSYRFVELPFRRRRFAGRALLIGPAAGMVVFCLGAAIFATGGLPGRISSDLYAMRSGDAMWAWPCREVKLIPSAVPPLCTFGARTWGEPGEKALLWGDSNAQQFAPMLAEVTKEHGIAAGLYDRCWAMVDGEKTLGNFKGDWNGTCRRHRAELWQLIDATPEIRTIIIGGVWEFAKNSLLGGGARAAVTDKTALLELSLADMADELASRGRRLVIVSQMPIYMKDPTSCHMRNIGLLRRQCSDEERFLSREQAIAFAADTLAAIHRVAATHSNVKVIVPTDGMCSSERCVASVNGEMIYRDAVHLRRNLREDTNRELARLIGLDRAFSE